METHRRQRRLHRAQAAFYRSNSLFRGFVGGRGAGKSWIGAYDLLTKAKRARTYLIASPTSVLMSDTTFPTTKAIAEELGLWGPVTMEYLPEVVFTPTGHSKVKMTPYPTVQLTTGGTVRFRTAENPERLRGPNLSHVWLDEASLMPEEAYTIAIACLREAGEQGSLTATFTPKGLGHWTYNVFGLGRRDTAIVHCKTRENPFNPAGFHDTLAGQYAPMRQRQELDGEFCNMEGAEWPIEYFPESIWFGDYPGGADLVTSALALDPSLGVGERAKGCFATFVYGALDRRGALWVEAWMSQDWDGQRLAAECCDLHKRMQPRAILIETNGGQAFLIPLLNAQAHSGGFGLPLYGVNNVEKKEERIRAGLTPRLARGEIRFRDTPGTRKLVQQLRDFPVGEYVDGPDALEMLCRMIQWILGHRGGPGQPEVVTR